MRDEQQIAAMTQGQVLPLFVAQAVVFTLCGIGLWYWSGRPIAEFAPIDAAGVLHGFLLAGALIAVAVINLRTFPRFCDRMIELQRANFAFLRQPFSLAAVIILSISAGVGEEALFRGGLQTILTDFIGPVPAIIVASALFAVIHLSKPVITALIFVIGIIFGVVYSATGSLVLVMVAHSVYDVFAIHFLRRRLNELGWADDTHETIDDTQTKDNNHAIP